MDETDCEPDTGWAEAGAAAYDAAGAEAEAVRAELAYPLDTIGLNDDEMDDR